MIQSLISYSGHLRADSRAKQRSLHFHSPAWSMQSHALKRHEHAWSMHGHSMDHSWTIHGIAWFMHADTWDPSTREKNKATVIIGFFPIETPTKNNLLTLNRL